MQARRWVNQSQPQTLVIAVFLLYIDAVFLVLFGALFGFVSLWVVSVPGILLIAGYVAAGWGIANEQKWAYFLGLTLAVLRLVPYVFALVAGHNILNEAIPLMFAIALVALLVHPQSRDYQRIWFR